MKRESFKSRLGFLLVSAGCAIGIGNVWRFPYVTGENGGGLFVLLWDYQYLQWNLRLAVQAVKVQYLDTGNWRKKAVNGIYMAGLQYLAVMFL